MANSYSFTQKVSDLSLAAFYGSMQVLDHCNTELAAEYQKGMYGIGQSVQIRKKARYVAQTQDASALGGLSLTLDSIQQETETLTVNTLLYTTIDLNAMENAFYLRGEDSVKQEFIDPAVQSLKKQAVNLIYKNFVRQANYVAGSGSTVVNSQSSVSAAVSVMDSLQMPLMRSIGLSPRDNAEVTPSLGAYFQPDVSREALISGAMHPISGFMSSYKDDSIRKNVSGTASLNLGLSLNAAVASGATQIDIASIVIGETIKVGDVITFNGVVAGTADVFALSPIDKQLVEDDTYKVSVVVAAGDGTTPDYSAVTETYTATAVTMLVNVARAIVTSPTDHFRWIQGDGADQIPTAETLTVETSHRSNMCIADGGISIASPPIEEIANSEFARSNYKGLNLFVAKQGNLAQLKNTSVIGLLFGVKCHPEYLVRLMSGA